MLYLFALFAIGFICYILGLFLKQKDPFVFYSNALNTIFAFLIIVFLLEIFIVCLALLNTILNKW